MIDKATGICAALGGVEQKRARLSPQMAYGKVWEKSINIYALFKSARGR